MTRTPRILGIGRSAAGLAGVLALVVVACTPKLDAPREATRITGTVVDVPAPTPTPGEAPSEAAADPASMASADATTNRANAKASPTPVIPRAIPLKKYPVMSHMPVGVAVYEACSPLLYFMKKCPGRFLGEAKLKGPGTFVVEVDTHATEILVFGFRGFLGPEQQQEACAEAKVSLADATKPLTLSLEPGTCSIKLERRYG